jgi:outer membrane protein assembly factor BamB
LNKSKIATAIAVLMLLIMTIQLAALPTVIAQGTRKTYAFIGATPNPVGVGQQTLLHVGITQQLQSVNMGWEGLTVTVTSPDGTTQTLGPFRTDSTGGTGAQYTPASVGNYTLQTHFPEQVTTADKRAGSTAVGAIMLASDSDKLTLIVTQEPRQFYPGVPLPTEYWTRPINQQFREWYPVAKSFLGSIPLDGIYVEGHDEAPESGHILWTKPLTIGGLVGGEFGELGSGGTSVGFETGDAYQGKFSSPGIIAGILIYTHHTSIRPLEYTAVNVRTGETLWKTTFLDNRSISLAQLFYWESFNYQGAFAYLWVTSTSISNNWVAFDAYTGQQRLNITNVPSGTNAIGPRGEIYRYSANLNAGYMTLWNMSALMSWSGSFGSPGPSTYNASATSANGTLTAAAQRAYAWNITIPKGLPGSIRAINWTDGRVVGSSVNLTDVNVWSFAIPPLGKESPAPNPPAAGSPGQLLFQKNWKAPADWVAGNQTIGWSCASLTDNVGVVWSKEARVRWGFSLTTGEYLWGPTEPESYLAIYETWSVIAYGKLYTHGMKGTVDCYDVKTGQRLWTYANTDPYTEILWSNTFPIRIDFVTAGKLYCRYSEHSANQPLPRGSQYICLNATTGEVIWKLNIRGTDWGGHAIIGDSVIAQMNTYDQQVTAIGKGPSAITVSAGPKTSVLGDSVVIEGTVTDVSPGTKQTEITLRFPTGVPAVSDDSMNEWMKYVYAQFPRPTDITGVKVTLSVLDANDNYREIGTTTADSDGFYSLHWTPDIEGKYTVYASFDGSKSYYPSHATTAFAVDPAPPPDTSTNTGNVVELPPIEAYFIGATVVIILAIAIVGFLLLSKRP